MSDMTGPQGTPEGAPGGATTYGSLLKRFLARIIDGLIVGISVSIVVAIIPGIGVGGLIGNVIAGVAGFAYFVFLETSQGATLGKKALNMSVADASGASPIAVDASVKRNWWMLLGALGGIPLLGPLAGLASLVIVIAIAVTINSDEKNQGLHDKMGDTVVLQAA